MAFMEQQQPAEPPSQPPSQSPPHPPHPSPPQPFPAFSQHPPPSLPPFLPSPSILPPPGFGLSYAPLPAPTRPAYPAPIGPPPGFGPPRTAIGPPPSLYPHPPGPLHPPQAFGRPVGGPGPLGQGGYSRPNAGSWGDEEERADDLEQLRLMQRLQLHPRMEESSPLHHPPHQVPGQRPSHPPAAQQPSPFLFHTPQKPLAPPPHVSPDGVPREAARYSPTMPAVSPLPTPGTPATPGSAGATALATPATPVTPRTPATPATPRTPSTPAVYVPAPSVLTQAIKPHLRRGLPAFSQLPHSPAWDAQLLALLGSLIPPSSTLESRDACRADLERLIQRVWPTAQLKLFGSSVNLLCDQHSDCDLSLLMPPPTQVKQSCYNVTRTAHSSEA